MSTWGDSHELAVYCSGVKDRWENETLGRALGTGRSGVKDRWENETLGRALGTGRTWLLSGVGGRKVAISGRKGMEITQGLGVGRLDAV